MSILNFFKKQDKASDISLDLPPLPEPTADVPDLPDVPNPDTPTDLPMPPPLDSGNQDVVKEVKGKDMHALPLDESLPPLSEIPPLKSPEPPVPEPPKMDFPPIEDSIPAELPEKFPELKHVDVPPAETVPLPSEPKPPEIVSTKEPSGTTLPSLPSFDKGKPDVHLKTLPEFGPEDILRYKSPSHSLKKRIEREGPLFVGVEQFQGMLEGLNSIKDQVKQGEDMAFRLVNLNNNLEKELSIWHSQIEDVQRKLIFMDKTLFER